MPTADQSARNVRATDRSPRCFLHNCVKLDVDSQSAESLDDALRANFARIAEVRQLRLEHIGSGDVQREEMNLPRPVVRAQLGTGDDANSKRLSGKLRLA